MQWPVLRRGSPTLGPGLVLGAISTLGLVVSVFMTWRTPDPHPSGIPFAFLFDSGTTASDPSILLALIPMAFLLGIGTAMPQASAARIIGAAGTNIVVALVGFQLNQALDKFPGANLGDVLDTGLYVAAISALVGLVSGFMPSGWAQRRRIETETTVGGDISIDDPSSSPRRPGVRPQRFLRGPRSAQTLEWRLSGPAVPRPQGCGQLRTACGRCPAGHGTRVRTGRAVCANVVDRTDWERSERGGGHRGARRGERRVQLDLD